MATIPRRCVGANMSVDQTSSSDDETGASIIYAFLPPMVRRSMPKVHSIRRSLNTYRSFRIHSREASLDSSETGTITPPPAYQDALPPLTSALSDDESSQSEESASGPVVQASFSENDRSGIQWKYASQGLNLLTLSAQESSLLSADPSFSRQLYLDAATYLLRGLPEDLCEEESISLRAAMPNVLIQTQSSAAGQLITGGDFEDMQVSCGDQKPTVLHRMVAMTVLQLFIVLSFLWPYVQVFVRSAYDYERQHHVSERFATQTWSTANAIGKRTMSTANLVCTWNDGQVGETLESVVTWWIQGVAGGLCEGMGEGMEVLGVKPNPQRSPRRRGLVDRQQRRQQQKQQSQNQRGQD